MAAIKAEYAYFLGAMQFLTRLPVPDQGNFTTEWLDRGLKYFPLAGLIVGAISAAVLLAASLLWSGALPALLAIAAGIAATGAFHEDGFADFFDCMGGATREARLAIMKDSRLGTFGATALGMDIALKVFALAALAPAVAAAALIAAHAGGRFASICFLRLLPYAGDASTAKAKPLGTTIGGLGFIVAACFALPPLFLLSFPANLVACLAGFAAASFIAWRAKRLLGGFTGDVLGAIEQAYEIAFLLAVAACI